MAINIRALNLKKFWTIFQRGQINPAKVVVLLHCENFWADSVQFSSVLVQLPCPPHNPFQDMSVSNANRVNPLEIKRCKFAPNARSPQNSTSITGDNVT